MAKRKAFPQIAPPDPDQMLMAGVAPVSMGERLARQSADTATLRTAPA